MGGVLQHSRNAFRADHGRFELWGRGTAGLGPGGGTFPEGPVPKDVLSLKRNGSFELQRSGTSPLC